MSNTDPLADAFAALPRPATRCPLGIVLDDASDLARERLNAALALSRQEVPDSWILAQLRAANKPVGKGSVSEHRRGACRCVG